MSFRPYNVPPTAPTRPPIAAPVPAPRPPPAIAPPAAPTAAPPTPPMAASFTTSTVLSRWPTCVAAYWWQALMLACVGAVELGVPTALDAARGAGEATGDSTRRIAGTVDVL